MLPSKRTFTSRISFLLIWVSVVSPLLSTIPIRPVQASESEAFVPTTTQVEDSTIYNEGFLAINTNKSVYRKGEEALLQIGSLDIRGNTTCSSRLRVLIQTPSGDIRSFSTTEGSIRPSGQCGRNNVTDIADYLASYKTESAGVYQVKAINLENKQVWKTTFEVRDEVPLTVERIGATRINPFKADYEMTLKLSSNGNWKGTVRETLPEGFEVVSSSHPYAVSMDAKTRKTTVSWNMSLSAFKATSLSYTYRAPRQSPKLHDLGPLELSRSKTAADVMLTPLRILGGQADSFREARSWQIASDATNIVTTAVIGAANWNTAGTWVRQLTGTAFCTTLSTAVTGTGTAFNTELVGGDVILFMTGKLMGTLSATPATAIAATLTANCANAAAAPIVGDPFGKRGVPTAADDVVIGNASQNPAGDVTVTLDTNATVTNLTFAGTAQANVLTHSGTNGLIVTSNVTVNQPTAVKTTAWNINAASSTVLGNITLSGNNTTASRIAKIVVTTGTLNAQTDLIINAAAASPANGLVDLSGGAATLNLNGALTLTNTGGTLTQGTASTVNYKKAGDQTITFASSIGYFNLSTSGSGIKLPSAGLTVDGSLTIGSGTTFNASTFSHAIKGNYTNNGTFTKGSSTMTFSGTTQQTLAGTMTGSSAFHLLTFTNNSGSDPDTSPSVIFSAAATAATSTIITANVKVRFNAGSTYAFTGINWNGQAVGTRVRLRSSSTPTRWNLTVTGGQTVLNVDAKDSDASSGDLINASGGTNANSGNNINWAFVQVTIGATAGSKLANADSGATSLFANTTNCSASSSCAAFALRTDVANATLTSLKIRETGTADANNDLSNAAIFFDSDGNFSNGTTGQFGATSASFTGSSSTATFNGSLTMTTGTFFFFYVRFDAKSGTPTYPKAGETINFQIETTGDLAFAETVFKTGAPATLAGTMTVRPQITGYTNVTESALNFSSNCTTCGARIGPTSAYRQTVTISGFGFGTDPGSGSRDTASNKVEVVGGATTALADDGSADTNVSAWTNTSITVRTDTTISGNGDTSWGANFGGATALKITAASQAVSTTFPFFIFPQVTSLTVCNTGGTHPFPAGDNAREYSAADAACPNGLKDGEFILNGTRFGTASTGGYVRILGCDSTTCSSPSGSVTTNSWTNTAITAQVPTVIADNSYTGSLDMQQGTGTNNKTHTYTSSGFRVLPRILNFSPTSSPDQDPVTVNGNHFCQNGGACPSAFSSNDRVDFPSATTTLNATKFTSWSHTAIQTVVPTSSVTGLVYMRSMGPSVSFESNGSSYTVWPNEPSDPTGLEQYKNSGLVQRITPVGGYASSTPLFFTGTMLVSNNPNGSLFMQVEHKTVGTGFACPAATTTCAFVSSEGGSGTGPGPINCSVGANNCAVSSTMADGSYHWQMRTRHRKHGLDYYSNWVSFGGNAESATDFLLDTVPPAITGLSVQVGTNTATTTWNTSLEQSTTRLQYNKTGTFNNSFNCLTATDCTALTDTSPLVFAHSNRLINLDSGTTYYFRARSIDAAGNESVSATTTVNTLTVTQPAKTTAFHIIGATGLVSGGATTSTSFAVHIPESSPAFKSLYVELTGLSTPNATNNVQVAVNSIATSTYVIATNETSFRILYPLPSINLYPTTNTLRIIPSQNTNILSAKVIMTYAYTP